MARLLLLLALASCGSDHLVSKPPPDRDDDDDDEQPHEPTDLPEDCMFYGLDSEGVLWRIDAEALTADLVGETGVPEVNDVAIMADGRMFAFDDTDFYALSPADAEATLLAADVFDDDMGLVGADVLPDGRLLAGGYGSFGFIDIEAGEYADEPSVLSGGDQFSGDFAVIDDRFAFATVKKSGQNDKLVRLDVVDGEVEVLGTLGVPKVYGLDFGCDGELYGLVSSDPPEVLHLDVSGGGVEVTSLGTLDGPKSLWGAAGPTQGE